MTMPDAERIAALEALVAELRAEREAAQAAVAPAKPVAPSASVDDLSDTIGRALESLGRLGLAESEGLVEKYQKKLTGAVEGAVEGALARIQDGDGKKKA